MNTAEKWHGTTIVLLRKGGETIVAGDGQVSLGNTVLKSKAKKVRKIENRGVIAGFAGSTADALTSKSIRECFDSCSNMWSKKPIPVLILYFPFPSKLTATEILVSLVFLVIFAFLLINYA